MSGRKDAWAEAPDKVRDFFIQQLVRAMTDNVWNLFGKHYC
jgi:hypothetical protein